MTKQQLIKVMIFQLESFSGGGATVSKDTIHSEILTEDDGVGTATSKRIYRLFVRWTLIRASHEDNAWPKHWIELSVDQLATKLIEG